VLPCPSAVAGENAFFPAHAGMAGVCILRLPPVGLIAAVASAVDEFELYG
jgi:hypothetical protein